ncbi:MAG: hypothetical protein M0Q38_17390 [Bacteroidales bacterium]|jgi:hypothetical protein|nr:hypothetical protein [Bacteroidales bacterium]
MKVIFSRKGFDSQFGGFPSPILPDGRLVSLPIPNQKDDVSYSDLLLSDRENYYDLMMSLKGKFKYHKTWFDLNKNSKCHLDPDLFHDVVPRKKGWKPIFGQIDAAQTHLENEGVKEGDIFLFFGTFRHTEYQDGHLWFIRSDTPKHIIFGYLQIEEILKVNKKQKCPVWMESHPHASTQRREAKNNAIYISRDSLTWNSKLKGAGTFMFDERLVLTKDGFSKSRWELSDIFRQVPISCHSAKNWKPEGYFQTNGIGQEFVVHTDKQVEKWVKDLINKSKL